MDASMKSLDEASYNGDIKKLKELVQEEPLLLDMVLKEERNNPLHIGTLKNHVEFTREVLVLKPELAKKLANQLNREGQSPLHLAAARGHLQVAKMLVDKVGDNICLIRESKNGYMPVHTAAINGRHDIVQMLVEKCGRQMLKEVTNRRETLLHLAVMANCLECVRYLVAQHVLDVDEKDEAGNTCLHLASARRNRQIMEHLLAQGGTGTIINSRNETGVTPLDVLVLSSLGSPVDISLVDAMRSAGAKRSTELGTICVVVGTGTSTTTTHPPTQSSQMLSADEKLSGDAQTLLIVATLVAAITFQAITSPPGGFIQPPFEESDALSNSASWTRRWENDGFFPAGRPVLLYQLSTFFILDTSALFSSVSVILWLLIAEPKTRIVMKFLVAIVWFAVFCTAASFGSAFLTIYDQVNFNWVVNLLLAFFGVYVFAGLWATVLIVSFLWRLAGFKSFLWLKNCMWFKRIIDIFRWLKGSTLFRKIICSVLMVCAVGAFVLSARRVLILIVYGMRAKYKQRGSNI